jgi:hypothetical protein
MEIQPFITITAEVRSAIHEHPIIKLANLNIPKLNFKTLMMKTIHQIVIKYLTCLVLNKSKLDFIMQLSPPPQ